MTALPLISGFTVVRDAIARCSPIVETIRQHEALFDEHVIVEVGSEDDTRTLLCDHFHGDARVRLVSVAAQGAAADAAGRAWYDWRKVAAQRMFEHCRGRWIAWLHADEMLHEDDFDELRRICAHQGRAFLNLEFKHFIGNLDMRLVSSLRWRYREAIVPNIPGLSTMVDPAGGQVFPSREAGAFTRVDSGLCAFNYSHLKPFEEVRTKVLREEGREIGDWSELFGLHFKVERYLGAHPRQAEAHREHWRFDDGALLPHALRVPCRARLTHALTVRPQGEKGMDEG